MFIENERLIIYQLMQEIIKERRELSKQYFDLKERLEKIDNKECCVPQQNEQVITILEAEKIKQQDFLIKNNKTVRYISFDRVSKNIVSILKQSPMPMSNRQIQNRLNKEYELSIALSNLTSNILPKMKNERSVPVQKACRGYWQYKQVGGERSNLND